MRNAMPYLKKLKQFYTDTTVLVYADYTKPFHLHTDASKLGVGVVLYQKQKEGPDLVVAFTSQMLSKPEWQYNAHKLEFLALKWSIIDHFHKCLYGRNFDVYADNNPLTYTPTSVKLDMMDHWWVAALEIFYFEIHYKFGKQNIEVDALSRIPWLDKDLTLEHTHIRAIIDLGWAGDGCKWAESYTRRWEELGSWNSEGVDQPLIPKTAMVSIPSKIKKWTMEGRAFERSRYLSCCKANTIKRALYL